jgi:Fe-S-cluster containining protein
MSEAAARKTCSFDVCCECTRSCCQDAKPPLTAERRRIIENYLRNRGLFSEQLFTSSDYSYPSVNTRGYCVFYDKGTKKCLVHQVKPETCRAGPVTFDINLRSQKVEWFLKKAELCLFAGKIFEAPEQLNGHLKVAKEEITRLICQLDSAALRAILKIEEPQTFKIGEDPLPKEVLEKLGVE